ncbi:MAG TPA: hypothetical protein VK636_21825, partial [Gemmatimonadaceae bacterium]|nr:hypothetical protein [Gemmatimonadaceae bacterium]
MKHLILPVVSCSVLAACSNDSNSPNPLATPTYVSLVGAIHEHTGYSDGIVGTTPATELAHASANGLAYMLTSEHTFHPRAAGPESQYCKPATMPQCLLLDSTVQSTIDTRWTATQQQIAAATTPTFSPARGFEWTNDRFGHIGVYFSQNTTSGVDFDDNDLDTFYAWLTVLPVARGGEADSKSFVTFNHPGLKCFLGAADPGCNWNQFKYVAAADARVVGMEVFGYVNTDYGSAGPAPGYYVQALDNGWHVGAIGAEDMHDTTWAAPIHPKTVVLAVSNTPADIRDAYIARRFYAIRDNGERLKFTVNDRQMGERFAPGANLVISAEVDDDAGKPITGAQMEFITTGGRVVAHTGSVASTTIPT